MTPFHKRLQAHKGGLLYLKTELYWYNRSERDGVKGRLCVLLDAPTKTTPARAEPAFLLQGSLRARIAPNNITRPGPRHMRRGDVGWAGASYGPDFFVYLGAEPATHWGFEHTVWAEVADEQSFDVAEKINAGQPRATPPGEMHILQTRVPIDLAVDAA